MISNADLPRHNKVHLQNLILLIKDHIFFLLVTEMTRHQPKSHIVQKPTSLVLLRIEKVPEVVKDIVKQKVQGNRPLQIHWQPLDKFIVFCHKLYPVMCPVELKMIVDFLHQACREWLVLSKSLKQLHPVVQLIGAIFVTMVEIERLQNLNETSHDERKETNSNQHEKHCRHLFQISLRHYVSVAARGQTRDAEIDHANKIVKFYVMLLSPLRTHHLEVIELTYEIRVELSIKLQIGYKVESTPCEVRYDYGQQHKSHHGESLLDHVPILDRLVSREPAHCDVDDLVESLLVHQVQDFGNSDHSEQFEARSINSIQQVKRESCQHIHKQPPRLHVFFCDKNMIPKLMLFVGVTFQSRNPYEV